MSVTDESSAAPVRTGSERRALLGAARLYLVCDAEPGGRTLAPFVEEALAGGVDIVQIRDKRLDDAELARAVASVRSLCERAGALLIVNDRPAVARAAGADGVHIGQEDGAPAAAREVIGSERLLGISTHAPGEVDAAQDTADYIGVGPVNATPTKPGRPAVGIALVEYAAQRSRVPFFAIGGLHAGNVAEVLAAGATRIAVVRDIAGAPDPRAAAARLRSLVAGNEDGLERGR